MRLARAAILAFVVSAAPAAADERTGAVVVRVGPRAVTVGELEDRLAKLPPVQRATYGATPEAIRKKFVEDVVVPELLLELGADAKKLAKVYPVSYDVDRTKADSALRAMHEKVGPASAIPASDVQKYYDEHRPIYDAPERINLWRILVKTKEEADSVLADAKKDPAVSHWNQLARDKSLDKTTAMRGGNLGFVTAEGASNETGVKVDAALVAAAKGVKDGELVPAPVAEADGFDVVWRRGTVGAAKKGLADVEAQIRDTLHKQRVEAEMKALTAALKKDKLKDFAPDVLDTVDLTPSGGTVVPKKRPGQVPPLGTPSSSR